MLVPAARSSSKSTDRPGHLTCCISCALLRVDRPSPQKVRVPKEEAGMVSDLRYGWKKLRKQAGDVSNHLARLQVRRACTRACGQKTVHRDAARCMR